MSSDSADRVPDRAQQSPTEPDRADRADSQGPIWTQDSSRVEARALVVVDSALRSLPSLQYGFTFSLGNKLTTAEQVHISQHSTHDRGPWEV
eukprot:3537321-Prymnesium_polylepis.2